jgi:hypothetical protein
MVLYALGAAMILLFVAIPILLLCCAAVGYLILRLFFDTKTFDDPIDDIVAVFWLGACGVGSLLELFALSEPITPLLILPGFVILVSAAVFLGFRSFLLTRFLRITRLVRISSFLLLLFVASRCASLPVDAYDTGLYHQSAVSFLSRYGLVRGVAWFQFRLGFTSSWFSLAALLNHGVMEGRVASMASALVLFVTGVHWLSKIERLTMRCLRPDGWFLLLVYPGLFAGAWLWHLDLSLSPDVPLWLITALAGWAMLVVSQNYRESGLSYLPFLLGCFAFAIKLSAMPVLIVTCIFAIALRQRGKVLHVLACLGACSIPALITFAANIKTSGCPSFPSSLLCLQTDWNVSVPFAQNVTHQIQSYASSNNIGTGFAANNWAANWIGNKQKAGLLGLAVSGTIASLVNPRVYSVFWPLLMSWLGIGLLFIKAPNPRFGLAYFFIPVAAAAFALSSRRPLRAQQSRSGTPFFVAVVAFLAIAYFFDLRFRGFSQDKLIHDDLLLPVRIASSDGEMVHRFNRTLNRWEPLRLQPVSSNGVSFTRPLNSDQCWDASNCTPDAPFLDEAFRARDIGGYIGSGFVRIDQIPAPHDRKEPK